MQIYIVKFVTGDTPLIDKLFKSLQSAKEYTDKWNQKLIEDKLHYGNFNYNENTYEGYIKKYGHYIGPPGASYVVLGPFEIEE